MKQVIVLKLEPTPEQHAALLGTLEAFNRAAQHVADVAYQERCASKVTLQKLVYRDLRETFGLSSQMAIRAISKACEVYKRDKRVHVHIGLRSAMVYDERIMSFKGLTHASLLTLGGRELIPMRYGAYQAARLDRAQGQADLILRRGTFYLSVTIDLPSLPPDTPKGVLGVDLGIVNLATDSEGEAFSGEPVKTVRRRTKRIQSLLQHKGTKSAKRHLKKRSGRQRRFVRDTNHRVSKHLVQKAKDAAKALALEDLTGIRDRASGFGRDMRWLLGGWSFGQLRAFIAYKAEAAGVPVILVDPRNTSRTCSACGHCEKANRKSQAHFHCLQCGFDAPADWNAAVNVGVRAEQSAGLLCQLSLPPNGDCLRLGASPHPSGVGR